MIECPYCGKANIEGADTCEKCQQPLHDLHLPTPATLVERSLLNDRIDSLETKTPRFVEHDQPVGEVLRFMVKYQCGCVIVLDDKKVVGVFSERDALMKMNTDAASLSARPVSEFMTPNPRTLLKSAKIAFAVQRMDLGGYRHVPIVNEEGEAEGIISVRDILRYLTDQMSAAEAN